MNDWFWILITQWQCMQLNHTIIATSGIEPASQICNDKEICLGNCFAFTLQVVKEALNKSHFEQE